MSLDEIITRAIPTETCPQKNESAMNRRKLLRQRIIKYIEESYESVKHTDTPRVIRTETVLPGMQNGN
jgi:hypothetical protein